MAKKYASLATLQTFLDNLKNVFAFKTHKHTVSDISDYVVDSELSDASTNPVQNVAIKAKFDDIDESVTSLGNEIDKKTEIFWIATSYDNAAGGTYTDKTFAEIYDAIYADKIVMLVYGTMVYHYKTDYYNDRIEFFAVNGRTLNYISVDTDGLVTATSIDVARSNHTHDYLPLTGGSLSNATTMPLLVENTTTGDPEIRIAYMANGGVSGFLGFQGENNPTFWDKDFNAHGIYHEGNPPTASDVGAAPASHEHSAYKITSGILSTEYGGTGNTWGYVQAGAQEGSSVGAVATAEGRETIASGSYSHAEGNYTEATGLCAHSEGQTTKASGNMSHAQGESTEAKGKRSHAEGDHTIAAGDASHVQGIYNIEDTDGKYAHIVGNGDWKTRSNAHTLDWDGNGWFAGNVYVGGTSQDDVLASKLISKADQRWNLIYDSGEISDIANSISNIDVSGYTNIQVLVRIYNDGDSINSRNGAAIFTCENGKTYQFPVWTNMFSKSINTVYTMATFNLVDGWLVCPCASRLIGDATTFDDEGGTAGNLVPTGSGMMKCTSKLSTLTISSLDQNSNYYFGTGSRVMVWGWNA